MKVTIYAFFRVLLHLDRELPLHQRLVQRQLDIEIVLYRECSLYLDTEFPLHQRLVQRQHFIKNYIRPPRILFRGSAALFSAQRYCAVQVRAVKHARGFRHPVNADQGYMQKSCKGAFRHSAAREEKVEGAGHLPLSQHLETLFRIGLKVRDLARSNRDLDNSKRDLRGSKRDLGCIGLKVLAHIQPVQVDGALAQQTVRHQSLVVHVHAQGCIQEVFVERQGLVEHYHRVSRAFYAGSGALLAPEAEGDVRRRLSA